MTERLVLSFGAGAACLSTLVFGLCAVGLARTPWLILSALLVMALLAYSMEWRRPRGSVPLYFWMVGLPFAAVYIVNAAAPEISPDGSYYHLGLVRRYLNHGGFYRITTDMFANLTQGCEMLFLVAYAVARHSAAALTHCMFLLALPAAMIAFGRRFGAETAGVIAAGLVFVSPVMGIDGSSAYVDVALAFAGFVCWYGLELWRAESSERYLWLAGLMAGFCFAIKYTGGIAIVFAVLFVLWSARRIRPAIVLLIPAAIVAAPWLIKNWMMVDNPVSPFLNRMFPNPYIHVSFEDGLQEMMRHMNGVHIDWQAPLELTVRGGLLQGTLGPAFLLAPLGLLAIRDAQGRRALGAAALFGLPWFSNAGTRFLIPALPFLALSMAIPLARWPWVLNLYCAPYNWRITRFPIAAALRLIPEQQFLDTYAPEVRFARLLQDKMPPGGVVYTAQPVMSSYTDRTIMMNFAGALNERLSDTLATAIHPAMQPSNRFTFRFPAQQVRKVRIVATGAAPGWTINELTGGRASGAQPNPWDADFASDGRLATSWRAWQTIRKGMYLQADIRESGSLGFVSFLTRPADPPPQMRLDGQLPSGQWRSLSSQPVRESGLPVPDLRGEAIAELRRCGVTHVLIHDQEPLGPDFQAHLAEWRVRLEGAAPPVRLYSISPAETVDSPRELRNNTR
jgi:hypothetical protein